MGDSDSDSHSWTDDISGAGLAFGVAALFVVVGGPAIIATAPIWLVGGAIILLLMFLSD